MAYRPAPELLKLLAALPSQPFDAHVWRHMFADNPPTRENTSGARWNPPGVPAIYCGINRDTAVAEGTYAIEMQPLRPRARRVLYEIHVGLERVLDLSERSLLREVGLSETELTGIDLGPCQRIGGTVEWLEHDGLLVPSVRASGANLVILPRRLRGEAEIEVVGSEQLREE